MKKTALIILTMILVLAMGQSVLASNKVGLSLGYINHSGKKEVLTVENGYAYSGFLVSLSANYYFNSNISIAAKANASFGKIQYSVASRNAATYDTFEIDGHLFGRYDAFNVSMFTIAPQLGVIYNYNNSTLQVSVPNIDPKIASHSVFVTPGFFVSANVSPKVNIYLDSKFPVFYFNSVSINDASPTNENGFFKYFFYDLAIGGTYAIAPNFDLGIEATVSNSNSLSMYLLDAEYSSVEFSIGAKVEMKF